MDLRKLKDGIGVILRESDYSYSIGEGETDYASLQDEHKRVSGEIFDLVVELIKEQEESDAADAQWNRFKE